MTRDKVLACRADLVTEISEDLRQGRDPYLRVVAAKSLVGKVPPEEIPAQVLFLERLKTLLISFQDRPWKSSTQGASHGEARLWSAAGHF